MSPAVEPPEYREEVRMLVVDTDREQYSDHLIHDLPRLLQAGDVLVVNDAATLPASLRTWVNNMPIELRLASRNETGWTAVLFGRGDWRTRTEDREDPPAIDQGTTIQFERGIRAIVTQVSAISPRLIDIKFNVADQFLIPLIYDYGTPIQYAYQNQALDLWSVQTVYGSQPWAFEMPSAGRPLTWSILLELRKRGIEVVHLTHAAGLSSTGDPALDRALPLPEYYDIPESTVTAIVQARKQGRRVIAVGTTVVRALEGCVEDHRHLRAGRGRTNLRIGADFVPQIVSGILSGMHHVEESHYQIIKRFASSRLLEASWNHAVDGGYRCHEFGDLSLWLPSAHS